MSSNKTEDISIYYTGPLTTKSTESHSRANFTIEKWNSKLYIFPYKMWTCLLEDYTCFSVFSEGHPWICLMRFSSKWADRLGVKEPGVSEWLALLDGAWGNKAPDAFDPVHNMSWLLEEDTQVETVLIKSCCSCSDVLADYCYTDQSIISPSNLWMGKYGWIISLTNISGCSGNCIIGSWVSPKWLLSNNTQTLLQTLSQK